MLLVGTVVDNRTLCELFGVGIMGGIRVNKAESTVVVVNNNTDPTYRNEWRDGALHFVGRGSVGPQALVGQNKTLANATKRGWTIHLFEVHEKSRYTYAGEVELVGEPYLSEQPDARAHDRFVWIFPLRKKDSVQPPPDRVAVSATDDYLPHGAYAVIRGKLTGPQRALVHAAIDKLKKAGISIFDRRDVLQLRYEKALAGWHAGVLDRVRAKIKELIACRRRSAKAAGREFALVDDELRVSSASTEAELRAALALLDFDDPAAQAQLFDEAMGAVPMPDPPESLQDTDGEELERPELRTDLDRADFSDFT